MAWGLADAVGSAPLSDALYAGLIAWTDLTADEARVNDPREFLPFCGLQELAARYPHVNPTRQAEILARHRSLANDLRWRTREAMAMDMQRIGMAAWPAVRAELET